MTLPHEPGGLLSGDSSNYSIKKLPSTPLSETAQGVVVGYSHATGELLATPSGSQKIVPVASEADAVSLNTPITVLGGPNSGNTKWGTKPSIIVASTKPLVAHEVTSPDGSVLPCAERPSFAAGAIECPSGFTEVCDSNGCYGCQQNTSKFLDNLNPAPNLNPSESILVIAPDGGCSVDDPCQWYVDVDTPPAGTYIKGTVIFNGRLYTLACGSGPKPPGIGCDWKYGKTVQNCVYKLVYRCVNGEVIASYDGNGYESVQQARDCCYPRYRLRYRLKPFQDTGCHLGYTPEGDVTFYGPYQEIYENLENGNPLNVGCLGDPGPTGNTSAPSYVLYDRYQNAVVGISSWGLAETPLFNLELYPTTSLECPL